MASLLTIPLELLVAVSAHLSTPDLASLRLTCRQVETSLYEWFSDEFFSKKQFMLTVPSLQTLIDISKHPIFSKRLKHVIIATNVYDSAPLHFQQGGAATRYGEGHSSQSMLFMTGIDREMLTEAFKNLVNLHTIGIRDFNARCRLRDGQEASWTSWGATTVFKETGKQLSFKSIGTNDSNPTGTLLARIFPVINYALGKAGRFPPRIEVLLRKTALPESAFDLPDVILPTVEPLLRNLSTLLLTFTTPSSKYDKYAQGMDTALGRLLTYTPNLSHLRLNCQRYKAGNSVLFLRWLSVPALDSKNMPGIYQSLPTIPLHLLQVFELGYLEIVYDIAINLVIKFAPSLQSISFWNVKLCTETGVPTRYRPNIWADLFGAMVRIPNLHLTHLKVGMLRQQGRSYFSKNVLFTAENGSNEPELVDVEHNGRDTADFLKGLVDRVKAVCVGGFVDEDEDEDDMDEDEDEDEMFEDEDEDDMYIDEDENPTYETDEDEDEYE